MISAILVRKDVQKDAVIALIHHFAILAMIDIIYPLINAILVHQNVTSFLIYHFAILAMMDIIYPLKKNCSNSSFCYSCNDRYYLSSNKCYSCPSECNKCSNLSFCYSCNDGYYLSFEKKLL